MENISVFKVYEGKRTWKFIGSLSFRRGGKGSSSGLSVDRSGKARGGLLRKKATDKETAAGRKHPRKFKHYAEQSGNGLNPDI